jgi:hypothetical protein
MAQVVDSDREAWIGVRQAAVILGTTPYSVKSAALSGLIKTRLVPPFRTVFRRADVEAMREGFDAA